jgi:hypothetical protein
MAPAANTHPQLTLFAAKSVALHTILAPPLRNLGMIDSVLTDSGQSGLSDTWIGIATIILLIIQSWIFVRQVKIMKEQEQASRAQMTVSQQQMDWRRDEAIGTFYRLAFDLVSKLSKSNGIDRLQNAIIQVDYNAAPRQVLRTASREFAPLGNSAIMALNQVGLQLDEYYAAVRDYGYTRPVEEVQPIYNRINSLRQEIGTNLDLANRQIIQALRWKDLQGKEFNFTAQCSNPRTLPPGLKL